VAIIGASHARNYAASDALRTCKVVKDLPHWTPSELHTAATCKKLKDLKLGKDDCVILDLFSNSTYMGTDNRGLPNLPIQDEEGRYHIEGQLDVAPLRALGIVAGLMKKLVEAAGEAKVLLVLPLPRYVLRGCCDSPAHVTNLGAGDYQALLASAAHTCRNVMEDALDGISTEYIFYNPVSTFTDGPLTEMKASDGQLVWATDDPVHLTEAAYGDMGLALLDLWLHSEFTTRRRVDSIIVDHAPRNYRGRGGRGGYRGGSATRGRGWQHQQLDAGPYSGRRFNPY
jgi:hypothetical protein